MGNELEEFHHDLFQDVIQKADGEGKLLPESFFEIYTQELIEVGDITEAHYSHYEKRGIRVDGYGGDPNQARDHTLSIMVHEFDQSQDEVKTLTRSELDTSFKRLSEFVTRSLDSEFRNSLEETDPAFGLTDIISTRWNSISKVRMFIFTNKVLSSRVDRIDAGQINDVPVVYSVWDLSRMYRNRTVGEAREEMTIDLVKEFGGAIPALPAHVQNDKYESYIAVLPARQLARIYDKWSDRLLEQNVRVFMQARTSVNKGLRNTLQNEPDMFFAYNNGITATAEKITTRKGRDGIEIMEMKNFQIVNGGQTTGSIYTASRNKDVDLSKVFIQMKLSVIHPDMIEQVVPKISLFANSQTKVNASDFFSNSPFHVRIEEFSRRIYASAQDGTFRDSKWFYERARGQYQDARARLTDSKRKAFDIEFPQRQRFIKTDLAKFINVWESKPDVVSKGAQFNFGDFAENVGNAWDRDSNQFNEMYYRYAIAKAIIFRETEKLVSDQPWYETGGYRANIVAYTIAKLAYDLNQKKMELNFETIWRLQTLTPELSDALAAGSTAVKDAILNPGGSGYQNITEWAKQSACWTKVQLLNVNWPDSLKNCLLTADEQKDNKRVAKKDQKVLNGIAAQKAVANADPAFWESMRVWGSEKGMLTEKVLSILNIASSISITGKMPSDGQCDILLEAFSRLKEEGFPLEIEN